MVLVDHIAKRGEENYLFYTSFKGTLLVKGFRGGEDAYQHELKMYTVSYVILCFEEFLILEKGLSFPPKNKLQTYIDNVNNIKGFIKWGLENSHQLDKVLKTSLKVVKKAYLLMKEMPNKNKEEIRYMYFFMNCVTLSVESRRTIKP